MTDSSHQPFETTNAAPAASNWRPTTTSVAVVVTLTATFGGLLTLTTGLWNAVLPAVGGAVLFAAALSLSATERYRPLARFVAASLLVPASAAVVSGVGYALAKQLGGPYPVGSVFVVVGLATAGFGSAAAVRGDLSTDTVASTLSVATVATLPPTLAFAVFALARVLGEYATTLYVPVLVPDPVPASAFPLAVLDGVRRFLLAPVHDGPHLFSFALVCYVAVVGLSAVLRTYPVADLLSPSDPESAARVVDPAERAATFAATVGVFVVFVAGVLFVTPDGFAVLPPRVRGPLTTLAGVDALRPLLFVSGVVGVALGTGSWAVRGRSEAESGALDGPVPSLLAGVVVALCAFVFAEQLLSVLLGVTLAILPDGYAADVRVQTDAVVAFYGGDVVLLGLAAGLLLAAAVSLLVLYAATRSGTATDGAAGAAAASSGLFAASAVAGTVGASTPLVFAGLVASLVVADAGSHGTTLGREVGRLGETRRAELVHLAATAVVGVVGATLAGGLASLLGGVPTLDGSVLSVALGGAVLGVFLFAVALR
ncbi:DUF7519 family protein [Halogeometricum limi]|uniref:Uncharacterized protein n=1 Tax=Halogeometricum limi TaxID=555875 RepID=A0A1I6ILI0_9EURY|nr:hypothetical protein [Halogeometricum limi]SFR67627.1 hypothetical protein SAMN04488124_3384 [Halogeometricum limi]